MLHSLWISPSLYFDIHIDMCRGEFLYEYACYVDLSPTSSTFMSMLTYGGVFPICMHMLNKANVYANTHFAPPLELCTHIVYDLTYIPFANLMFLLLILCFLLDFVRNGQHATCLD